jgi:uncharacterized repeat protein (TIGR03803 family)
MTAVADNAAWPAWRRVGGKPTPFGAIGGKWQRLWKNAADCPTPIPDFWSRPEPNPAKIGEGRLSLFRASLMREGKVKSVPVALFAGIVAFASLGQIWAAEPAKFNEKVIWSFGSGADGQYPWGGVVYVKGKLYGTTGTGGGYCSGNGSSGCGSVFALDPLTGAETVVHSFCSKAGCADGLFPQAGLIDFNGTLYGTTVSGGGTGCGGAGCGTVFSIDPETGTEKVLRAFSGGTDDGAWPQADLIDVNGIFYGTTMLGGVDNCLGETCGTVFSLDPATGAEKVIYSFCSQANCYDGASPSSSLNSLGGIFYGTTQTGGVNCHGKYQDGCGTVFSLDPVTGAETVLHSFCSEFDCVDGAGPFAGLIKVGNRYYGATWEGGNENEHGTIFRIDPASGKEKVLYSFCSERNCTDGAYPYGQLIDIDGLLYGTTRECGNDDGDCGYGAVFVFDPDTGVETVLHTFLNGVDGAYPIPGLIDVKGTLYGTTQEGGANGAGTVFAVTKMR